MSASRNIQHSTQQALHYSLLNALLKGSAKLPQMPENVLRIRSLLKDQHTTLEQLSRVINSNPPLAAYLMQFADSPLLRTTYPCRSLRDVLNRLGSKRLNNLILSFAMRNLFISKELALQKMFRARWKASLERAAWAACLSNLVPGVSTDDALLGGLFQDIGSLPLLAELEHWPDISREAKDLDQLCERLSAPIGTALLTVWKQPDQLINCARHRSPLAQTLNPPSSALVQLVQIATVMQQPERAQLLLQIPLAQQLFSHLEPTTIAQCYKSEVNLWFTLLGVKTRGL